VYAVLAVLWLAIAGWQGSEHVRIRELARQTLRNRAQDIATSLSVVIRSQGRFGIVPKDRIEAALQDLTSSKELLSVALLNATGEVTVAAGQERSFDFEDPPKTREYWSADAVTFLNLVALGADAGMAATDRGATVVLSMPETADRHRRGFHPPFLDVLLDESKRDALRLILSGSALTEEHVDVLTEVVMGGFPDQAALDSMRAALVGKPLDAEQLKAVGESLPGPMSRREPPGRPPDGVDSGRPDPGRPPWLSDEEYQSLLDQRGVHWFVLTVSTAAFRAECARDLSLRLIVAIIAGLATVALAFAWHSMERSAGLRVRLARAGEMNVHLQEMNVAAAGLAHETKNPLNLVRGSAQMIARHRAVPDAVRGAARDITEEVDRVSERLNRFMDYSRPIAPAIGPTDLGEVVRDVARVLETDREDKAVALEVNGPEITVRADRALLRQVLFNLLLNALEAVPAGGRITVNMGRYGRDHAFLEVSDNGPGVPDAMRSEVFRPYVTTSAKGTGLGLAVVRQIVLAHQWDIACETGREGGACFRVSGLHIVNDTGQSHA